MFNSRLDRVLAISAGTGLFVLGAGELVARLGESMPAMLMTLAIRTVAARPGDQSLTQS